ncbi:MAG: enoyl-ACP reductase, partial [Gemmatimonadetes bacterium]|nr:enoyl-ACP reductase [Gemmatimonadota bacterium]
MKGADNPVGLVTGGGVRVGRAIALGLARDGYDLVVNYRTSAAGAEEVAGEARRLGRRVHTVQA